MPKRAAGPALGAVKSTVAIVGNPSRQGAWDDAAMEAPKRAGFNTVQLNIAWEGRSTSRSACATWCRCRARHADAAVEALKARFHTRVALARRHAAFLGATLLPAPTGVKNTGARFTLPTWRDSVPCRPPSVRSVRCVAVGYYELIAAGETPSILRVDGVVRTPVGAN